LLLVTKDSSDNKRRRIVASSRAVRWEKRRSLKKTGGGGARSRLPQLHPRLVVVALKTADLRLAPRRSDLAGDSDAESSEEGGDRENRIINM
jgi:hypothetical protein